jgi:hypothetical protein
MSAATWIASSRVGTRTSAPGREFGAGRALDDRNAESQRLARACRRLGENVEAGERVREHEPLDGEWMGDPGCLERTNDGRADAELLE